MPSLPNPSEFFISKFAISELSMKDVLNEIRIPLNCLSCIVVHGDDSIEKMYICAKGEDAH